MKHKSYSKSRRNKLKRTKNTKRLRKQTKRFRRHTKRLRRHTKRLRRHTKRLHKDKKIYRLRGGYAQAPMPEPVYATPPSIVPGNPMTIQAEIAAKANAQNQANQVLVGGGKRRLKQRGGDATICGGTVVNGADGYGYTPPNNCLLVPTVNNPAAQLQAITASNTLNIGAANAAGDSQVGKMPP